ncbi:MAG: hypothetical protein HY617_02885 [Candidatus Sungbacteria bacterium]|nr:hypothetical protein [Candidatus Sungbacteria bacterium]
MILTTHAVIGAAAASMVPEHPVLAFGVAFASHFAFDAIPHWHYPVASIIKDKKNPMNNDMVVGKHFIADVAVIGFDALLGIGISLAAFAYFLHVPYLLILIGALGGILPDPLQFVYWKFRRQPVKSLQRLHRLVHAKTDLDNRPLSGVTSQVCLILAAISVTALAMG